MGFYRLLVVFLLLAATAAAQYKNFRFENYHVPTDVAASDFYGGSTAAWGEYAVSTTFLQDTDGQSNGGAAYVYRRNASSLEMYEYQKIKADSVTAEGRFGFAVDMCRKYIIVYESGTSTLYFFELDNADQWVVFDTATRSGVNAVACAGDYFAAGTGSVVQFYRKNGNSIVTDGTVTDTTSVQSGGFGNSLAMDLRGGTDAYLIAGYENYDDPNGGGTTIFDRGAAFIYTRTGAATWSLEDTLLGSDTVAGDKFGFKVDIHEELAVVTRTTDGGSFYVFTRDVDDLGGWTEQAVVDSNAGDCVAISETYILVGNNAGFGELTLYNNDGTTYGFREAHAMGDYPISGQDNIGDSCAITEHGHMLGGGTRGSTNGANSGAVVIFRQVPDTIGGFRDPVDGQFACDAEWQYRATAGANLVDPDSDGCLGRFDASTQPFRHDDVDFNASVAIAAIDSTKYTIDT